MRSPDEIKVGEQTLAEILEKHLHWLETWTDSLADLNDADLSYANLCVADLHGADLSDVDLSNAVLTHTSLYGADRAFSRSKFNVYNFNC